MYTCIASASLWRIAYGVCHRGMVMAATERRSSVVGGAQHAPNRILVIQLSTNANEAKVFKAHAAPLGLCDNLVKALKPLANQQNDGDGPIESIVTGLHEKSRKGIIDGLTSLIKVDNHSAGAVDVGGLRRGTKSIQVKKPKFSEAFPEADVRDGADELTLRAEEVGLLRTFVDTKHVELERWMRTDTPSFSTITTKSCTRRQGPKSLVTVKRQGSFGQRKRQGTGTLNFTIQRIRNTCKAEPEPLELWEEQL